PRGRVRITLRQSHPGQGDIPRGSEEERSSRRDLDEFKGTPSLVRVVGRASRFTELPLGPCEVCQAAGEMELGTSCLGGAQPRPEVLCRLLVMEEILERPPQ